jgi:hypothetical protein
MIKIHRKNRNFAVNHDPMLNDPDPAQLRLSAGLPTAPRLRRQRAQSVASGIWFLLPSPRFPISDSIPDKKKEIVKKRKKNDLKSQFFISYFFVFPHLRILWHNCKWLFDVNWSLQVQIFPAARFFDFLVARASL